MIKRYIKNSRVFIKESRLDHKDHSGVSHGKHLSLPEEGGRRTKILERNCQSIGSQKTNQKKHRHKNHHEFVITRNSNLAG